MKKASIWDKSIVATRIKSANVKPKETIFGYFLGPMGALLTSQIFVAFLNTYYTDVLGMASAEYGKFLAVFPLISIVFVVIGNLLVGQLLEKYKTSQGKARPFLLISAPLLAVACVLVVAIPKGTDLLKMIWVAVSYNLYYAVAFPLYYSSNSMMVPLSTRNGKQRGILSSAVSLANLAAAGLMGSMVFPMFIRPYVNNESSWIIVMCIFGGITLVSVLLQYFFTRERITEENVRLNITEKVIPIKIQIKAVVEDKFWWIIIIFLAVFNLSGAMQNFSMVYYCDYILGSYNDGYTQTILAIVTGIPLGLGILFSMPLANRIGKKNAIVIGLIVAFLGSLLAFLNPTKVWAVYLGMAIKCLGVAPANYVMLALFADVLEHIEAKNGFRCDGFCIALYSIILSVLQSICTGVFGAILTSTGYVAPTIVDDVATAAVQNDATKSAFVWCYIGVLMVGSLVCAFVLLFLNVEEGLEKEKDIILERQKAKVIANGEVWLEPSERMRIEQEENDALAEVARIEELKTSCARRGKIFEDEESKYQAKLAQKQLKQRRSYK